MWLVNNLHFLHLHLLNDDGLQSLVYRIRTARKQFCLHEELQAQKINITYPLLVSQITCSSVCENYSFSKTLFSLKVEKISLIFLCTYILKIAKLLDSFL